MCIVAIAHLASSRYPFIVAANRDERHARPSAAARWWNGPGSLLAGRDLTAGGSWLGITGSGRFAAVTNIFEAGAVSAERSRGSLVTDFLNGSMKPSEYADSIAGDGMLYGPFNLVLKSDSELHIVSNRSSSTALAAGIHVFSNNAPGLQWTKVGVLRDAIASASVAQREDVQAFLIETLTGPNARGSLDRAAEALFVVGKEFGTRSATVVTVDAAGKATFVEQRFAAGGIAAGRSEYLFDCAA